jgi:Bacterial Ig-like domain (group 2)
MRKSIGIGVVSADPPLQNCAVALYTDRIRKTRCALGIIAWLSVASAACGGGGSTTGPNPPSGPNPPGEPASTLVITRFTKPIQSGTSVQATASISSGGSSSPATDVTWSSSNPAIASVASGLVTGGRQGTTTITATSEGLTGHVAVTVVPGAPVSMRIYAGNNQSGPAGSQLPDALCTNVMDAAGNFIIGARVSYVVTSGGGKLAVPTTPATDASGIAISGLWTLGPVTGPQTVTASSPGAGSVVFTGTGH